MDLVVTTSRGRCLEHYFRYRWSATLTWRKGATIKKLTADAKRILRQHHSTEKPHHVFFIAGLPDLTKMTRGKNYQEVIFDETPQQALNRLKDTLLLADKEISTEHNAKTCFATITPCSLRTWNHHRLQTNRTAELKHEQDYGVMQDNLIQATILINKFIINLNEANNMPTPRLAKKIIKKSGIKRQTPRVYYAKMPDGVHLNEETAEEWISTLSLSMLEARHPELFRNGQYIGNQLPENKPVNYLPDPPTQSTPMTMQDPDDDDDDNDEDDETVSKRQWRSYWISFAQ